MTTQPADHPTAARRLMEGLINRASEVREVEAKGYSRSLIQGKMERLGQYAEAAHIALVGMGYRCPLAPFGLVMLALQTIDTVGNRPSLTSPDQVARWRIETVESFAYLLAEGGA